MTHALPRRSKYYMIKINVHIFTCSNPQSILTFSQYVSLPPCTLFNFKKITNKCRGLSNITQKIKQEARSTTLISYILCIMSPANLKPRMKTRLVQYKRGKNERCLSQQPRFHAKFFARGLTICIRCITTYPLLTSSTHSLCPSLAMSSAV